MVNKRVLIVRFDQLCVCMFCTCFCNYLIVKFVKLKPSEALYKKKNKTSRNDQTDERIQIALIIRYDKNSKCISRLINDCYASKLFIW